MEAIARRKLHVEFWACRIPALLAPTTPGFGLNEFDQLSIGVSDRVALDHRSVVAQEPHLIESVGVDVGPLRVVDVRLKTTQAEQPVHHGHSQTFRFGIGDR